MSGLSKLANRTKLVDLAKLAKPDFELLDHGSICILVPMTEAAEMWVSNSLDPEAMRCGPGVVIEPRYVGPIVEGIQEDGLEVER